MALGYRQRAFQGYRSVTHGGALFRVDPERAGPNSRIDHPEYFAPPAPLYAQKRLYLWVAEHPDVYKLFPLASRVGCARSSCWRLSRTTAWTHVLNGSTSGSPNCARSC